VRQRVSDAPRVVKDCGKKQRIVARVSAATINLKPKVRIFSGCILPPSYPSHSTSKHHYNRITCCWKLAQMHSSNIGRAESDPITRLQARSMSIRCVYSSAIGYIDVAPHVPNNPASLMLTFVTSSSSGRTLPTMFNAPRLKRIAIKD
jgi:hypothetical protein